MSTGSCKEKRQRRDHAAHSHGRDDSCGSVQLVERILKQALELKAEQHLDAEHLHARLIEGGLEGLLQLHEDPNAQLAFQLPAPRVGPELTY